MSSTPSTQPPTLDEQMAAQARIRDKAVAEYSGGKSDNNAGLGCLAIIGATAASVALTGGLVGGWLYLGHLLFG